MRLDEGHFIRAVWTQSFHLLASDPNAMVI